VLLGLPLAVACGGSSGAIEGSGGSGATSATDAGATTSAVTTGSGGGTPEGYSVTFGPVEVAPGQERTQCVVKRLGNASAIHVGRIHNVLLAGSHHLIVYRTNDTDERTEPFDCDPFVDTLNPEKGSPLMITQKHEETLELPPGVAFTLDAQQMVRLEMHYINVETEVLSVEATSTLVPMSEAEFQNEADFLFVGSPDISIPPQSSQTLGPVFFKLPSTFAEASFFAITGHTHQWGTDVRVSTTPGEDGPDAPVYAVEDWQWSEPATVYQDPPFQVPSGGGFRFTCEWQNSGASQVGFGESANDEMCFFWAYYYPSQGAYVCVHTDQVPGGFDLCCPGNPLCDQIF
jgi:hypothetical protein